MSKINNQIRNNYKDYNELKTKRKTVLVSPIDVKRVKDRHPSLQFGNSNVTHQTINKNLNLEVEVKIDNSRDFKFKLFCSEIFEKPFFRFDSAGAVHRNNDPAIPLKEQQVTTPHFHEYNAEGIEIAYKTEALLTPAQLLKLENINVCIMHFCEEGNMRYQKSDFPEVNLQKGELGLKFTNEDPLKNIGF